MKIKLNKLTMINFKGTGNRTIEFNEETYIYGANGTGKTTIFDAFTWLLFGKDSDDSADFNIKTLNRSGHVIEKLDHEVIASLNVDGKETEFRRVLREKWVTKRGSSESVFEGNETTYFIDGVPLKAKEYTQHISEIIDESLFKLITNPMTFNTIKWQDRRQMLINIAGDIHEDEVITKLNMSADQKQTLLNIIQSDLTLDKQKAKIAAQIKANKDELKQIPARIDEAERSKPQIPEGGFDSLKMSLSEKQTWLEATEANIKDGSKSMDEVVGQLKKYKSQRYELESKRDQIRQEVERSVKPVENNAEAEIKELDSRKTILLGNRITIENGITTLNAAVSEKREEWEKVNAETFDENSTSCPTCSQPLPIEKVNEMVDSFVLNKSKRLEQIQVYGKALSAKIKIEQDNIEKINTEVTEIQAQIKALSQQQTPEKKQPTAESILEGHSEYNKCIKDIESISKKIDELDNQMKDPQADSGLIQKRDTLKRDIKAIEVELIKESEITRANNRIEELKKQEKELAQNIANVEKDLFLIDNYTKVKIDTLEKKINSMFGKVNFKMFEQQINGGEAETCICTADGVPFYDLNTAMKINAGLDIIKTLSEHYNVYAPIFIDHRESVTELIEIPTQIINLVVSASDNELRIA